jgi:plastocyanin
VVDPEQLYQEVLQEEQQKGSSAPVAEGRAKAARARAEAGSPHPKEPKWWPGGQPHFDGGDGAGPAEAPAEEAPPADETAAEEPAAEQPAAQAPAEQPAAQAPAEQPAAQAPAEQPAAQAPAEQPAAQAPAEQPAAQAPAEQPAAQAPAEQPAAQAPAASPGGGVAVASRPTVGVTHGTASGNRLRPEDAVATDAQFAGQRAMYERRKLIDELVATGVPAVAASDAGRSRAPWLSVLYLLIPILVIAFLVTNGNNQTAAPEPPAASEGGGGDGGGVATDQIVAQDISFDADTIEVQAKQPTDFTLDNQDSALHNLVIVPTEADAGDPSTALFQSPDVPGGSSQTFTIDSLKKGEYYFFCEYHTNMNGAVEAV